MILIQIFLVETVLLSDQIEIGPMVGKKSNYSKTFFRQESYRGRSTTELLKPTR